jgi:CspA family cold shock protein
LAGSSGRIAFAARWGSRSESHQTSTTRTTLRAKARLQVQCSHDGKRTIAMTNGTVKFYNSQKGFGFIQPDDGGKDVFVHATAFERAGLRGLNEGQKVAFDTQQDRRTGKTAVGNIQIA